VLKIVFTFIPWYTLKKMILVTLNGVPVRKYV